MIFTYAVGKGIIKYNMLEIYKLKKKTIKALSLYPVEDKYNFSQLLSDIDNYKGQYNTKMALKLTVLVGFRPNNIVSIKWKT